ncbi:MarR family winged helix-turn-helix transcriptional regulator [Camelliibacillus cellulosilyticus]|uniref:MarR family winged helix-turn-helix transcriptional regulator n=1 Tax=Camelliibacillus cellulosilyticus TaxID=2174486 RepID=A0ABV9GQK7_9BACL
MKDRDAILVEIVLDIIRAANLLERLGGKYAQKADLSSVQQYMILGMLFLEGDLSMGDLRENTLVTKQAVTGLVDRLNRGGYLETYTDSRDRRITRVRLTPKGQETLQIIRPLRVLGNRKAFSVLSDEEFSQLSAILPKLIRHLKNELD